MSTSICDDLAPVVTHEMRVHRDKRKNLIKGLEYDFETVQSIYGIVPWDYLHYADLYRSWVEVSGVKYGAYGISEDLGIDWDVPWYETFKTYVTVPNGQTKNFLVAIRTVSSLVPGTYRIAVRGSRAGHGTGQWHVLFLSYLLDRGIVGDVFFFDPQEDAQTYTLSKNCRTITVTHVPIACNSFEGYDVLIDDAYQPLKGLVPIVSSLPPVFSVKGVSSMDGHPLFLHPRESRLFSSAPCQFRSMCRCMVCNAISQSVSTYTDYASVRRACFEMGFMGTTCVPDLVDRDLVSKGVVRVKLDTLPIVPIRKGKEVRAVMALKEEVPIHLVGDSAVLDKSKGVRSYHPYIHNEGFVDVPSRDAKFIRYPHLEGREVFFSGVEPNVLGDTQIRPVVTSYSFPPLRPETVAFIGSKDAYNQVQGCSVVYMKGGKAELNSMFLDRKYTGRTVGPFLEMARTVVSLPEVVSIPSSSPEVVGPDKRTFPVPYHWYDQNRKSLLLLDRCACDRMGVSISCDLGPLNHVYDLCMFFTPGIRYSEMGCSERLSYFPVTVESGLLLIHPQQKCVPANRDPDFTLWRSATLWGIVSLGMWPFVLLGDYWDSSTFCAKLRVYEAGSKGSARGQIILYPEKWLDSLSTWLSRKGSWVLDRRLSLGPSLDHKPSADTKTSLICSLCGPCPIAAFTKAQCKKKPRTCRTCT